MAVATGARAGDGNADSNHLKPEHLLCIVSVAAEELARNLLAPSEIDRLMPLCYVKINNNTKQMHAYATKCELYVYKLR